MVDVDELVRTVPRTHRLRSPEKNLEIEPERPRRRILEIEPHHIVEWKPASPVHLPEPGDSWLHFQQAPPVPDVVGLELVGDRGPWADHRHVTPQYVEKLRELVQAGLSQESPDARQPRVFGDFVDRAIRSGGALTGVSRDESLDVFHVNPWIISGLHGAELQAGEGNPILTNSLLAKQDGPA